MFNFSIENAKARLTHINLRNEKHGDEDVPAVDLKFEWPTSNDALALFHPDLRDAIFQQSPADRAQTHVAGVPAALKALVFPSMLPLRWGTDSTGLRLTIDHGLGGKSDLVMHDCIADKFVIEPMEGGSVAITFRVRTTNIAEELFGRLASLLGHDVPLTLVRQHDAEDDADDADDDAQAQKPAPKKGGKRKASEQIQEAFIAGGQ